MCISNWSSDVCSSDLLAHQGARVAAEDDAVQEIGVLQELAVVADQIPHRARRGEAAAAGKPNMAGQSYPRLFHLDDLGDAGAPYLYRAPGGFGGTGDGRTSLRRHPVPRSEEPRVGKGGGSKVQFWGSP